MGVWLRSDSDPQSLMIACLGLTLGRSYHGNVQSAGNVQAVVGG